MPRLLHNTKWGNAEQSRYEDDTNVDPPQKCDWIGTEVALPKRNVLGTGWLEADGFNNATICSILYI